MIQGLAFEIGQLKPSEAPVPGDFYFWGGSLAAKSRLALIAYACLTRIDRRLGEALAADSFFSQGICWTTRPDPAGC